MSTTTRLVEAITDEYSFFAVDHICDECGSKTTWPMPAHSSRTDLPCPMVIEHLPDGRHKATKREDIDIRELARPA